MHDQLTYEKLMQYTDESANAPMPAIQEPMIILRQEDLPAFKALLESVMNCDTCKDTGIVRSYNRNAPCGHCSAGDGLMFKDIDLPTGIKPTGANIKRMGELLHQILKDRK